MNAAHKMLLHRTIFIGGPEIRASVKIRCVQIAQALGCDYAVNVSRLLDIPRHKNVFICIKPDLTKEELHDLSTLGTVIWDIHDSMPPKKSIAAYIVSSPGAYEEFRPIGQIYLIPHHHCNLSGVPNPPHMARRPGWIGRPYWCPDFGFLDHDFYNTNTMSHTEIVAAYRKIGISLNLRAPKLDATFHARINPGIKLLNSIGFGIPSISNWEPAYQHYAAECTVFANTHECSECVFRLQVDNDLFLKLYKLAIRRAPDFHITKIARMYLDLLVGLAI